ncbi:MAG TPA: SLBB domain-containing protein [Ferruginibacter sp.]|nr:SLBB domain-containing protein [Ferruginibacter sp.]
MPAISQPPTGIPQEINPNQINPQELTQPQLRSLLEDKNRETGKDRNAELNSKLTIEKDSVVKDDIKFNAYSPDKTYGANFAAFAPTTSVDEMSTPPLDYPIGVGDNIIVALWGGAEFQENYIVARDGAIFPSGLGKIYVQGLTFENARKVVYARFKSVVPASTNISVSLGQPRRINVNVVGEVNNPGPVTVSAFSNAFNVIYAAGGVSKFGNLRNIQIKRAGKVIDELDVYKYLTTGDFGKHIYLQNNDFIIVGIFEKKVLATGQFKRPMYYQLRKDEGVKALLKFSGGLTSEALASNMKILRSENETQVQRDVNANAITQLPDQDFLLMDGDIVKVDIVKAGLSNKVEIRGEVTFPGVYELRKNDRLFDIINRAGGVTRNTFLPRAYVFRNAGDSTSLQSDRLEVDLSEYSSNDSRSPSNVELNVNDVIQLFSQSEFSDPQYVEIYGEIRVEGKVRKYGGMTLEDLLYLSGGLKQSAEFGRLEISSVVDMDSARKSLKPTRTVVKSYAIDPNLQLDSIANKIILKPYDQIFVRKNPNFEIQQNVDLKGLVMYPGYYPRLSKFERLSSFIGRAGGLADNANVGGALLYRRTGQFREKYEKKQKFDSLGRPIIDSAVQEKLDLLDEPVSIDLYNALKKPNSKYDIILMDGDVLFIPEINPFVTIRGRVQSPLKIAFDKEHTNLLYYIDKAGGYGIRPWKRRIYVTYANGRSKRTRGFLFFRSYPKVDEGSIVTIPEKPKSGDVSDLTKSIIVAAIPVIITGFIFKYIR